jgi:hypothetical protein
MRSTLGMGILLAAALAAPAAKADSLFITYTDAFSNSASLTLGATLDVNGGYDVTSVTGFFNGSPVTGPVFGSSFGVTSNEFYTDPSILPAQTIDSGFVFDPGGGTLVDLYAYNFDSVPGYATAFSPSGQSGAVTITSIVINPEPTTGALVLGALGLLAGWRKLAVRRS